MKKKTDVGISSKIILKVLLSNPMRLRESAFCGYEMKVKYLSCRDRGRDAPLTLRRSEFSHEKKEQETFLA